MQTFTCEICGNTYDTEKTDEQAMMEYHAALQKQQLPDDERAVICDDCFKEFNKWYSGLSLENINDMRAEEGLAPLTEHPGPYYEPVH